MQTRFALFEVKLSTFAASGKFYLALATQAKLDESAQKTSKEAWQTPEIASPSSLPPDMEFARAKAFPSSIAPSAANPCLDVLLRHFLTTRA